MADQYACGLNIGRIDADISKVEAAEREDTRVYNAMCLCTNMWALHTPNNADVLNPFFDRAWSMTPWRGTKFVDLVKQPISARNIVIGMSREAAAFVVFMIQRDLDEDEDIYIQDVIKPDCTHMLSLAAVDNKGVKQYLHGIPWHLMTMPMLLQHCPKLFTVSKWWNGYETIDLDGHEITSTWIKAWGSLNEYMKNTREARARVKRQFEQNHT